MSTRPLHQQFALKVLILFLIETLLNFFLPLSIIFLVTSYMAVYFVFAGAVILLIYKNIKIGWYVFVLYLILNLIFGATTLSMIYRNLIHYSDANWGGYLTFIIPTIPLIFYLAALRISLSKENRDYFKIILRSKNNLK